MIYKYSLLFLLCINTNNDAQTQKICDIIKHREHTRSLYWSFEFFLPKTDHGINELKKTMQTMHKWNPAFIDIAIHGNESTPGATISLCRYAQEELALPAQLHLTLSTKNCAEIDAYLDNAHENNACNILALRGDPTKKALANTTDLIQHIRQRYGDYFHISVAGHPHGTQDLTTYIAQLHTLKEKVDAGADLVITQLFFDTERFFQFVHDCRETGIACPILPGILIINNYESFKRITKLCQVFVPPAILSSLEAIKDNPESVSKFGQQLAITLCKKLIDHGIRGFHFYTMNNPKIGSMLSELQQYLQFYARAPLCHITR